MPGLPTRTEHHERREEDRLAAPDLARAAERMARAEGKTLSGVVQDALRDARAKRLRQELGGLQGHWGRKAKEQGILSQGDLERFLRS